MPAQIAHILAGKNAAESYSPLLWEQLDQKVFYLGCQGPDIFYHNQRTRPSGLLYGSRMHRWGWGKFCASFASLGREAGWTKDHPGFSYLAGLVTHGFLDRAGHPFVVYFSGWRIPSRPETDHLKRSHAFFERMLDVLLYEMIERENFTSCQLQSEMPLFSDFPDDFWWVFAQALWKTYPGAYFWEDALPRVKNAIADTLGFLLYTDPRNTEGARAAARADREASPEFRGKGPRIALYHPSILPPDDFLNRNHHVWLHPVTGEERTESFFELFLQSVKSSQEALAVLDAFWGADGHADVSLLENCVGNESLNLPGPDGLSMGPKFSAPLDFEHLMELQRRYWLDTSS